ncbi:MAG: T9SS type A sorting domain-containing protein [Bacteroidetes bacterium]|nr:T9SS type A sorting domain-containing protein [Bacteroidota bacterium]
MSVTNTNFRKKFSVLLILILSGIQAFSQVNFKITEIFSGQAGTDLTADWFEIVNNGNQDWVAGMDSSLFYDDDSRSASEADPILGLTEIKAGATAIILVTGDTADITKFKNTWGPVVDLSNVQIGYTNGSGLGDGGDLVTLWMGSPFAHNPIDTASYPATSANDGHTYDVSLHAFSVEGNSNNAVTTTAKSGSSGNTPNVGSPGIVFFMPEFQGIKITEIFSGQAGADLTADWFEIHNTGSTTWMSDVHGALYYDDESAAADEAVPVYGVDSLQAGERAIVVVGKATDASTFVSVWGDVTEINTIQVGYTDGAGLGGSGDAVAIWVGLPMIHFLEDTASYPDPTNFDGKTYDVELGDFSVVGNASKAIKTKALGGNASDVPNIGSPGNLGPKIEKPGYQSLKISEIFSGQAGTDLTADWFEIHNTGSNSWVANVHGALYYDDESADSADAVLIMGFDSIQAGERVIVVVGKESDTATFNTIWKEVTEINKIQIGFTDGAGLGDGGDAVTLWVGSPETHLPADTASYPSTSGNDGKSYDVELGTFSEVANASDAVQTKALGGTNSDVPNIASPGNLGPKSENPEFKDFKITEIFMGQDGTDLTVDWFEIMNNGSETWSLNVHGALYYDDESADASEAVIIDGFESIKPGERAIVVIGNEADTATFAAVWRDVTHIDSVQIGFAIGGAGLSGTGDAVTLWVGEPSTHNPVANASYPDASNADGKTYDLELATFSEVGNASKAVKTLAMGGSLSNVPNIGSPGNLGPRSDVGVFAIKMNDYFSLYPNPSNGFITIKLKDVISSGSLTICDINGKTVFSQVLNSTETNLDLSSLSPSVYTFTITGENGTSVSRLVIK